MKTETGDMTLPELILMNAPQATDNNSPALNQYYKCLEQRKIIFNQMVSSSIVELVILPLLEMDNDGSGEEIEIIMSTAGGSVEDSLVLCDVIDNLKTKTKITTLGYTYSMGLILLCAGYHNPNVTKCCYKFSTGMLHEGQITVSGTLRSVFSRVHFQEQQEERIKNYVCSHSKIEPDDYDRMNSAETYMTSEDMLKYGLVDEIL
jgi:ATP-dependent protease ClpP protease subunit